MSRPTTWAPSRASTRATSAPIPREAPVTSATLPASGRSQSSSGWRSEGGDPDDLARDIGRARREQEAQRRLDLVLGAGGDVDELRAGALADLLADRAGEALERALRGRLARRLARPPGGVPRTMTRPRRCDPADRRVEELPELAQLGRVVDPGGVEDQRLEALVAGGLRIPDRRVDPGLADRGALAVERGRDVGAGRAEHARDRAGETAAGRGAEQHVAADHRLRRARSGRARPAAAGRRCRR